MFAFRDGIDVALGDKVCACATGAMRRWHWGSAMRIRRPGHLACTGHGLAFVQGMALFSQLGKSVVDPMIQGFPFRLLHLLLEGGVATWHVHRRFS